MRLFHKKNGVITILLVIILVPILTANSVLVEMIRYRSSSQLLDTVANNAILSAMADYNTELYKLFGLLAMDGEHAEDVKEWVRGNINGDKNNFSKIVAPATMTVTTRGLYALDDVDVLKAQIMETEKLTGPGYLLEGVLESTFGYDDLFKDLGKEIKKAVPGVALMQNCGKVADVSGEAANAGLDYADKLEEWKNAKKKYNDTHAAYIGKINGILGHYRADYPDGQPDEENLPGEADRAAIEEAKTAYLEALDELNTVGGELTDCAKELVSKCVESAQALATTVSEEKLQKDKAALDEQKEKEKQEINGNSSLNVVEKANRLSEVEKRYEALEATAKLQDNAPRNVAGVLKGIADGVSDFNADNVKADINANVEALKQTIQSFDGYAYLITSEERVKIDSEGIKELDEDGNEVMATYYLANSNLDGGSYYEDIATLSGNADASIFEALGEELNKDLGNAATTNLVDIMKSIYGLLDILLNSAPLYDTHANGVLSNDDLLPSKTMTGSNFSFLTGDETEVNEWIASIREAADHIGYDVAALYPDSRGTAAASEQEIANRIGSLIENIRWLLGQLHDLAGVLQGKVLAFLKALTKLGEMIKKIEEVAKDIKYLAERIGQTLETAAMMLYEGSMLNSYVLNHFTSRYDITAAHRLNGVPGYNGTNFKFAKAEYVLLGDPRETENQAHMSMFLYAIRILLNVYPVFTSAEVGELAAAAGPLFWLVYIVMLAFEAELDVAALQGFQARIPICKPHLFYSLGTLETLKLKFPGIITGVKIKGDEEDINILTGVVKKAIDKIYDKTKFKFNYEDYLWLRLCFVSNDTKVKRIADLIYMDMRQKDPSFSLSNQYTYLRVEINADHSSVMPLTDALDIAKIKTVKYGGY